MLFTPSETAHARFGEDIPGAICHDYCYFTRHGETSWNCERRIMGWRDIHLNETGIAQAYTVQQYVKELGIQTICTSPLQRARQTADILNDVLQVPLVELSNLKEVDWGNYEGQIKMKADNHTLEEYKQGMHPHNAEPYATFVKRSLHGLKEALINPGPVLIVSHGGVFWALATFFNWPAERLISNCELIQIFFPRVHGEWIIRKVV